MTLIMGQNNFDDLQIRPAVQEKSTLVDPSEPSLQPQQAGVDAASQQEEVLPPHLLSETVAMEDNSKRRIVLNDIGYQQKRLTRLESVEAESSGNDTPGAFGMAMRAPGRLQRPTEELRVDEDNSQLQAPTGDVDSQKNRKAYAEIAQQTISSPLGVIPNIGVMQLTKQQQRVQQNSSKMEDFKLTVGSIAVTQGDSGSIGHTTQPNMTMTRSRLTNMMNTTSNNAMAQTKVADEKQSQKRTHSTLTKAQVSISNTEDDSFFKYTNKQMNSRNFGQTFEKQVNTSSGLSQTLYQVHESGKTLHHEGTAAPAQHLPFLKSGPARNEIQSSALLQFQPSTNSLNQGIMQANAVNMQSQSPLRTHGLDFDAEGRVESVTKDGRDQQSTQTDIETSIGQGIFYNHGNQMPHLKTNLVSDSNMSSKQFLYLPKSGQETPTQNKIVGPKIMAAQSMSQHHELSVQEYLQLQKLNEAPIDSSFFMSKFSLADIVLENSIPNTMRNSPKTLKKGKGRGVRDFGTTSKTPFLQNMTDQLFDLNKTTSKGNGIFSERSRSTMVSPQTMHAYTPKAKHSLMASPMIANKRNSSILSQKKSKAVRQLGYIKQIPDRADPVDNVTAKNKNVVQNSFSPAINFPSSHLVIKDSVPVGLKTSKGGHIGAHRFEEGEDTLNIPSQVLEQWLDSVLMQDQINVTQLPAAQNEHGKQKMNKAVAQASKATLKEEFNGIGKIQKVADSVSATLRYGLDYQSLTRNGMNKDQITRLHRALYTNTNGFYNTVKDLVGAAKDKKKVIVGVMQVYQQLLEKCHRNEWKMLINEVANAYEEEDKVRKGELQSVVDGKNAVIGNLKKEILDQQEQIFQKQKEVYKEKDAFDRLHEAYMILQHHNEQNLALRLQTEKRLKKLFKRERQHMEMVKRAEAALRVDKDTLVSNEIDINTMSDELTKLRNSLIEKEGINSLIKTEMLAQKRNFLVVQKKIEEIYKPYERLKAQEPKLRAIIETNETDRRSNVMKTDILSGQLDPFLKQIKLLENEIKSLKVQTTRQEEDNEKMSVKQKQTLQELTDRADTFYWAEQQLRLKDKELLKMEDKLAMTVKRMDAFEIDKQKIAAEMIGLEEKVRVHTNKNEELTLVISNLERFEFDREQQLVAEKERNELFQLELHNAERLVRNSETSTVWMMQAQIDDNVKHIAKLKKENDIITKNKEEDRKFHKDDKKRMHDEVEKYNNMQRKYRFEAKALLKTESRYRWQYNEAIAKNGELENQIILLKAEVEQFADIKTDHQKQVDEYAERMQELEIVVEKSQSQQIKQEAQWKAYEAQRKEGQNFVKLELDTKESRVAQAMNQNIMAGEDFRSKAFNNAMMVVELQEVICFLKAEPKLFKEQSKAMLTSLRKEIQSNQMFKEEQRQEILRLLLKIDGKDEVIAGLEFRHSEDLYLVEVMRNKIGISDYALHHQSVQVGAQCVQSSAQTEPPANHIAIQAQGFNLVDAPTQTDVEKEKPSVKKVDKQVELLRADSNATSLVHKSTLRDREVMPAKKVKKKGGVKKSTALTKVASVESIGSMSPVARSPSKSFGQSVLKHPRQNSNITKQQNVPSLLSPQEHKLMRVQSVLPVKSQAKEQQLIDLDEELLDTAVDPVEEIVQEEQFSDSVSSDGAQFNMVENSGKYINIKEGDDSPTRSKKKTKGSLSRPAKFKLENRNLRSKKGISVIDETTPVPSQQELTGPAVPEELARKTVRSGVIWHKNTKQQDEQKNRSKQMRGLIKSAVNRDLD